MKTETFFKKFRKAVKDHSCEWRKTSKYGNDTIRTRKTNLCPIEFVFRDKYPDEGAYDIYNYEELNNGNDIVRAADYRCDFLSTYQQKLRNRMLKILGFKGEAK